MNFFQAYIIPFLAVSALCMIPFFGLFYKLIPSALIHKFIPFALAMSAGILLGNAFFHLLPEGLEEATSTSQVMITVVCGIFVFFIFEKAIVLWKLRLRQNTLLSLKSIGLINLSGDALHNFIDGALIAGSFLINTETGMAVLLSVVLHEIPQEIGDTGTLLYSGLHLNKAIKFNIIASSAALPGAASMLLAHKVGVVSFEYLLPFTAGAFIYMALVNLMPVLLKSENIKTIPQLMQIMALLIGLVFTIYLNGVSHYHFPDTKKNVKYMGGFDEYFPVNRFH
ncbi:MAG: ZIP family metal transporter [Cyclobacteriaceae bacterium]|nr:ZIP family metal transporter [Cyclobacteriaceae bacterium]